MHILFAMKIWCWAVNFYKRTDILNAGIKCRNPASRNLAKNIDSQLKICILFILFQSWYEDSSSKKNKQHERKREQIANKRIQ